MEEKTLRNAFGKKTKRAAHCHKRRHLKRDDDLLNDKKLEDVLRLKRWTV